MKKTKGKKMASKASVDSSFGNAMSNCRHVGRGDFSVSKVPQSTHQSIRTGFPAPSPQVSLVSGVVHHMVSSVGGPIGVSNRMIEDTFQQGHDNSIFNVCIKVSWLRMLTWSILTSRVRGSQGKQHRPLGPSRCPRQPLARLLVSSPFSSIFGQLA